MWRVSSYKMSNRWRRVLQLVNNNWKIAPFWPRPSYQWLPDERWQYAVRTHRLDELEELVEQRDRLLVLLQVVGDHRLVVVDDAVVDVVQAPDALRVQVRLHRRQSGRGTLMRKVGRGTHMESGPWYMGKAFFYNKHV